MEEVHVTVESDTIGARDDVKMSHILFFQGGFLYTAVCVCFC